MNTFLLTLTIIIITVLSCRAGSDDVYHSDTLSSLLKGYDKVKKPDGGPVKVGTSIYVEYLKWNKNILTLAMFLRQTWTDSRLKSKTDARFAAEDIIKHIWKPNTFFLANIKPKVTEPGLVKISSDGEVTWSEAVQVSTPCVTDAKSLYENDGIVNCTLGFESYSLTTDGLVYSWTDKPSFSNVVDKVVSSSTAETKNKYPNGEYSGLLLNMKVQTKIRKGVVEFMDQTVFDKA